MPEFDPKDKGSMDWALTFAKAKMITELNDEVDTPVDALVKILNVTLASKSEAVTGYRREALAEPGHYRIVQFAKKAPIAVDTDYSKREADGGEEIKGLSEAGRRKPVALTNEQLQKVRIWAGRRAAFLNKWKLLDMSSLPVESQRLLYGSVDNPIRKNMTPDDLAAVIKERLGVQIPDLKKGGFHDHIEEFESARNSITGTIGDSKKEGITGRLWELERGGKKDSFEYKLLVQRRKELSSLLETYKELQ
jgi:hypothetical protein